MTPHLPSAFPSPLFIREGVKIGPVFSQQFAYLRKLLEGEIGKEMVLFMQVEMEEHGGGREGKGSRKVTLFPRGVAGSSSGNGSQSYVLRKGKEIFVEDSPAKKSQRGDREVRNNPNPQGYDEMECKE
jgi:hypothetical protein